MKTTTQPPLRFREVAFGVGLLSLVSVGVVLSIAVIGVTTAVSDFFGRFRK